MSLSGLQQLVERIQAFYQLPHGADNATLVWEQAEQLTEDWLHSWRAQQSFWLAQLALPAQTALPALLATRHAVLLALYCRQQKWPDWQREQLISSAWFVPFWLKSSLQAYSLEQLDQPIKVQDPWADVVRLLHNHDFSKDILRLFASCSRLRKGLAEWQQLAISSVLVLTYRIAIGMQPQRGKPWPGIEQPIRLLWRSPLPHGQRMVLEQLMRAAPALHQFARLCSDQIGTVCLITETEPDLKGYEFDMTMTLLCDQPKSISSQGFTLQAPRFCKDSLWWQSMIQVDDLPEEEEIPTPLSLQLLQQLNPNWGITKQLQWLQRQPQLIPYLQAAASAQTREKVQIDDLRHALAMLGTEQLPQILRLSWVQQQMQQQHGVLHHWFDQARVCLASLLRVFGLQSPTINLVYCEPDLIACCVVYVLQREIPPAALQLSLTGSQRSPIADYCALLLWQHGDFPQQLSQILAAVSPRLMWPDAALRLRHELDPQPRYSQQQVAQLLLRLALMEFQQLFLGIPAERQALQNLFKQAQQALDLPSYPLSEWRQMALGEAPCSQPIHGNL